MRKLIAILFLFNLLIVPAMAQPTGQLAAGQIWGNPTASKAPATATSIGAVLDRFYNCTSRGSIMTRGASVWECLNSSAGSFPLFSTGAGSALTYRALTGADLPNPAIASLGGVFSKALVNGQVLGGIDTSGNPQSATNAILLSQDANALTVGRLLATPAFQVDTSTASSITGVKITAQASGNGVNFEAIGETNVPLIFNARGIGTINFGTNSTGDIVMFRNVVANGAHSIDGQMAANTVKCNNTGSPALSIDCTQQQLAIVSGQLRYTKSLTGINFNSANTDNIITFPSPPSGFTRYSVRSVYIVGASVNISSATVGVFTAPAAAGTALVASGTAVSVTATTDSTNNNMQALTVVNVNTMSNLYSALTTGNLYFRVQTAAGAPATASVMVEIQWLP